MIFWDVENTSGEADVVRVLAHLQIDRVAQPTEFVAVGNWRSIGAKIARALAAAGARLVHSAPTVGVRDWSDLWIAVAAGQWLAHARPGDQLQVVSDDRAFDAVNDAAAVLGVGFKRISYRLLSGGGERERPAAGGPLSRGQRRRAARRRARGERPAAPAPLPAPRPAAAPPPTADVEGLTDEAAHAASHEQIHNVMARLTGGDSSRQVSLDALANALRSEGFTRPPGSPRLVTRLRRMKDIEVTPNGMVRLVGQAATPGVTPAAPEPPPSGPKPARRRARRRRPRSASAATAEPVEVSTAAVLETPVPLGTSEPEV
jgi:hypothetical protein